MMTRLQILGQFGFPDSENIRGRNIPSQEWRSGTSAETEIISGHQRKNGLLIPLFMWPPCAIAE